MWGNVSLQEMLFKGMNVMAKYKESSWGCKIWVFPLLGIVIGPFTSHFFSMLKKAFGLDYFITSLDFDGQESKYEFIKTFDNIKAGPGFGVIFFHLFCTFFLPTVAFSLVLGPKHFISPTSSKWKWYFDMDIAKWSGVVLKYWRSELKGKQMYIHMVEMDCEIIPAL